MSIIAIVLFIAIGVFAAWLVDINFLSVNRNSEKIEGYTLIQMLKENPSYEAIRESKKVPPVRIGPDRDNHCRSMDESRDRGDGGQILRLRARE